MQKKNKNMFLLPLVCLFILAGVGCNDEGESDSIDTYTVTRGDLTISVKESGTIKALEKVDIRSRVEGNNTILYLIPEGTLITDEDVKNEKVLVRLDGSSLLAKRDDQEVSVNNAASSYKQANISLEIQRNENESSISVGARDVLFAKMDLEKYLGRALVKDVMDQYDKLKNGAKKDNDAADAAESATEPQADTNDVAESSEGIVDLGIDYEALAKSENLGGGALQEKRILESDIELANEEVTLARNKLEWTNRLLEKGFVTKDEAEADALSLKRKTIEFERAQTDLDLFMRYDFAKNTEKLLSDYNEANKELERIAISCKGKEDKALDDVNAKKRNLEINQEKLKKYNEQIENCTIVATKPGLVVYANLNQGRRAVSNPIQEGTSVSENQEILTIPNLNEMGVELKIMEGSNHLVEVGMSAIIQIDRDEALQIRGTVKSVSSVANSADIFLGNSQPTYPTDVEIPNAAQYDLKPGMSAKVAILVQQLKKVIYVPLQGGIHVYKGQQVCYVKTADGYKCVNVQLGLANLDAVHVKEGLQAGDKILLREPRAEETLDYSQFVEEAPQKESPQSAGTPAAKTGDGKTDGGAENAAKNTPSENASTPTPGAATQGADQKPSSSDKRPPDAGSAARKAAMEALMAALTDDEQQKFKELPKTKMREIFSALEGKSLEQKVEYLRKNVLNQ